jgi:hypothetical protein
MAATEHRCDSAHGEGSILTDNRRRPTTPDVLDAMLKGDICVIRR